MTIYAKHLTREEYEAALDAPAESSDGYERATDMTARMPTWAEKHEARTAMDAYREAYQRAREAGLTPAEASKLAKQAEDDASRAYKTGR